MIENPWKGLVSYEETDIDKYEFCGRTEAIGRFYSLLTNNLISTLYGQTGCGKTSMLRAGIFPLLRQESFFPVECRASLRKKGETFADYLIKQIEAEIDKLGFYYMKSNIPVDHVGDDEKYKLWKYFYGNVFKDSNGGIVFPVIVLDQFEEILINAKDDSLTLLEQIHILVGDDLLLPDDCYANFRISISLREDYLYLLEDTLDKRLHLLRENRMRLAPLSRKEAYEIISLGDDFMIPDDRDEIYGEILRLSSNKRGLISTNMLSLICSQIYQLYDLNKSHGNLSIQNVKALSDASLKDFYLSSIKDISEDTVKYIEANLVDQGLRRQVSIEKFKEQVPNETEQKTLTTGKTKILQVVVASDSECVELIHDTLARAIFRVSMNRSKLSLGQKCFLIVESVLVPMLLGCYALNMFITNRDSAFLFVTLFALVLFSNWVFSVSSHGNKNISSWIYFILFLVSAILSSACYGNSLDDNGFLFYTDTLTLVYAWIAPIVNLVRKSSTGAKMDLRESLKYIINFKCLNDNKELYNVSVIPLGLSTMVTTGFISGFFMNTYALLLLPVCLAICYYLIHRYFDRTVQIKQIGLDLTVLICLSGFFIYAQHNVHLLKWGTYGVLVCMLFGAIATTQRATEIPTKQKIKKTALEFATCSLLPFLFLGYNPFRADLDGHARVFNQPKMISDVTLPMITVRNTDGLYGLADRSQMIFKADFKKINYISYDSDISLSKSDKLIVYLEHKIIGPFLSLEDSKSKQNFDITLYTTSGTYNWSSRHLSRSYSTYLEDRIKSLENSKFGEWTEEEFAEIAELSAAYRSRGNEEDTSKAHSLEVHYFLRRLLQAEIYKTIGSNDNSLTENCKMVLEHYRKSILDSTFNSYYLSTITEANPILKKRAYKYIEELNTLQQEYFEDAMMNRLKDIATLDVNSLKDQLDSYSSHPIPFSTDGILAVLENSSDFLFQTKESIGRHVIDSLYIDTYEETEKDNFFYYCSCAWFNIFLTRYKEAEWYAKRSIDFIETTNEPNFINGISYNIGYTNLITSLFLQNTQDKHDEALRHLQATKRCIYAINDMEYPQHLFPIQPINKGFTVADGVSQDLYRFIQNGIIKDTSTPEFQNLVKLLEAEGAVTDGKDYIYYPGEWRLWTDGEVFEFTNKEKTALPTFTEIDINIYDSIAICKTTSDKYRFLDLRDMHLIGDEYDYAWHFSEGLAAVEKDQLIGFINTRGEIEREYKHKSERWLKENHYKLAYHKNKVAITSEDYTLYNTMDINGLYNDDNYWYYAKFNRDGLLIHYAPATKWVAGTKTFDEEIDDIIINPIIKDTIPVYKHHNIKNIRSAKAVPEINVSGVWQYKDPTTHKCTFLYLGEKTSDYMIIEGKTSSTGSYYLSQAQDASCDSYIHFLSEGSTRKYKITIDYEYDYLKLGTNSYTKVKDLY